MTTKKNWIKRKEKYGKSGFKNPEERKEKIAETLRINYILHPELKEQGYRVIRLWEKEINFMDLNKFQEIIQ